MHKLKQVSKMHQRVNKTAEERRTDDIIKKAANGEMPVNKFWDETQALHKESVKPVEYIESILYPILNDIVTDPEKKLFVNDFPALGANVKGLTKYGKEYKDKLSEIYELHKDRTGGTTTPDDHTFCATVNQQYMEAADLYRVTAEPYLAHTLELIGQFEEAYNASLKTKEEQQQKDLLDPTVITDVVDISEVKHD
jgi:hypothetical protein